MKRVIITADDFGQSPEVNAAVIKAHQEGILTCASLMVTGAAAGQAIRLAKANPTLKVGLHLVLVDGAAVLSGRDIPDLVDAKQRFARQPSVAGVRYFFSNRLKQQLVKECEAQIATFRASGLVMDHLNSHHHLHVHPTLAKIITDLARRHAIPAVRLPYQGLRTLTKKAAIMAAVMFPWVVHLKWCLQKAGIAHNREIFGLYETGAMSEVTWLRLIPKLKPGTTEIFCHPATGKVAGKQGPPDRCCAEFQALLSSKVKTRLAAENVILTAFSTL